MTNDLVWNAEFSSRLDHPMLVGVTWRHDVGLDVYVDDICAGFDDVPQKIPDEAETESGDAISTVPADTFQFVEFLRPAGSPAELLLDFQSEGKALIGSVSQNRHKVYTHVWTGCMDPIFFYF